MTLINSMAASGPARFSVQRNRIQNGVQGGISYPSPFFDVAHTWLPATFKQLLRFCRYYFLTNPLVNAAASKLSEYPITDIIIDHEDPEVVRRWTEYFQDHLYYRSFQVETGLDYNVYGNSFVSISFPFKKYLYCRSCGFHEQAERIKGHWVFTSYEFRLTCPRCGTVSEAFAKDQYIKSAAGIRPVRWNPEDIEIEDNPITGERTYYYTIPGTVRNDVVMGRKNVITGIPQVFIKAMKENKGVILSKDNLFHMARPTLAGQDRGWGVPLLLPVLKDTFYLQIMKKAQEAILLEHIVPLRVIFPQPASGSADPFTSVNLVDWKEHVGNEIARWRLDNNYIPILPLPIGNQTIGGDGKSLLLTGEIQQWSEQIIAGMTVPREFIFGGLSYSGSSVSMRMLENAFIGYILRHKQQARFIMKMVAAAMEWPEVGIRFKPFKMADDIQRKAFRLQLNQAGKVSDTTLLADDDLSQEEENKIMLRETDTRIAASEKQQLAMADIQGKVQLTMAKYQVKAQQAQQTAMMAPAAPGEPGGPEAAAQGGQMPVDPAQQGGQTVPQQAQSQLNAGQVTTGATTNVDLPSMAMAQARMIAGMPPPLQQMALQNLQMQSPELADLVRQYLAQLGVQVGQGAAVPGANGQAAQQVNMQPLPENRPPRRAAGAV